MKCAVCAMCCASAQQQEAGEHMGYQMIGVNPSFDFLYDPEQARPAGWCPVCGREIFADGENLCRRCKEMEEQNAE